MQSCESLLGRRYAELEGRSPLGVPMPAPEQIAAKSYVDLKPIGVSMVLGDREHVSTIQLHDEGHEGHARFGGSIPGGARLGMTRDEARAALGAPLRSGEPVTVPVLGLKGAWDAWAMGLYEVRLNYAPDSGRATMVSLTLA